MKISVTRLNQVWENKKENFEKCSKIVEDSAKEDVDIVIFPEMTLTGFTMNTAYSAEDPETSATVRKFQEIAKNNKIAIIFGVVFRSGNLATNNAVLVSSDGDVIKNYVKIHPFSYSKENEYFVSGNELSNISYLGLNLGFTICYDLRFPELYRGYSDNCDIVINIANWPSDRIDHWKLFLQCRALENQMYIAGVNRVGIDGNNLKYEKSTIVVDPTGKIMSPVIDFSDFSIFQIDKNVVDFARNKFPALKDRKSIKFIKQNNFNGDEI